MRGAHRAFFLDDKEKTRAVELLRRVEEFCGVMVLAYAIMSNHFHIFIFVPEPEEIDDEKARRGYAFMYGNADDWDVIRDSHEKSMREAMNEILAARSASRAARISLMASRIDFSWLSRITSQSSALPYMNA